MTNGRKVMGAVMVAVATAIIIPIFGGDTPTSGDRMGEDPWRTLIFDFQTMFTGLAALAAATWTVVTMEITDARQEQRHRELVNLGLRADRLRADRAVNPQLEDFEQYVDDNLARLKHRFAGYAKGYNALHSGERSYREPASVISGFFHRVQLEQARDLFDGEMAYALERIHDAIEKLDSCWMVAEQYAPPPGMPRNMLTLSEEEKAGFFFSARGVTDTTNRCLDTLVEYTSAFHGGLVKLRKTYEL